MKPEISARLVEKTNPPQLNFPIFPSPPPQGPKIPRPSSELDALNLIVDEEVRQHLLVHSNERREKRIRSRQEKKLLEEGRFPQEGVLKGKEPFHQYLWPIFVCSFASSSI